MKTTIACFHSTATGSAHPKITGICHAAYARGWNVLRFDLGSEASVRKTIGFWQPDGCIIEAGAVNSLIAPAALPGIPTVYLDCNPQFARKGISCVIQDPESTAAAAAAELLKHDLRSYAYAAWPTRQFWDRQRKSCFVQAMKRKHQRTFIFKPRERASDRRSVLDALTDWVRTLPLPAGIFTATDSMSVQVLEAAARNGLDVPDDLMIVGVDNEEFICEGVRPMLSSVAPDFEGAGCQCVDILARLMRSPHRRPIVERFKSVSVVTRSSTRKSVRRDAESVAALDYIREHAAAGLTAADVFARFTCSRRLAEIRFRATAGRSVLDEIHAVQIEAAKRLLRNPNVKSTSVHQFCGHPSAPYFQRLFKHATGMTMSGWRQINTPTLGTI